LRPRIGGAILNSVRIGLGTTLVALTAAAVMAAGGGAAAAQPQWQVLPLKTESSEFLRMLGWASGRVWFAVSTAVTDPSTGFAKPGGQVWSARIQAGRLTSVVHSPVSYDVVAQSWLNGSSLVEPGKASTTAPLLTNGRVGAWTSIPGDPEQLARALPHSQGLGVVQSAVTVDGRTVWAIGSGSSLAGCCTESGEATDLTTSIGNRLKFNLYSVRLGVDAHQRLWLAWTENQRQPLVMLHLVQLDPAALSPRSSKIYGPVWHSAGGGSQDDDDFTMLCGDTCRLVFGSAAGTFSWAGDGPPTKILAANRQENLILLAAGSRRPALAVASSTGSSDHGWQVSLGKGDSRGRSLHVVGSTKVPESNPHPNETWNAEALRAVFTPSAVVVFAEYPPSGRDAQPLRSVVIRG